MKQFQNWNLQLLNKSPQICICLDPAACCVISLEFWPSFEDSRWWNNLFIILGPGHWLPVTLMSRELWMSYLIPNLVNLIRRTTGHAGPSPLKFSAKGAVEVGAIVCLWQHDQKPPTQSVFWLARRAKKLIMVHPYACTLLITAYAETLCCAPGVYKALYDPHKTQSVQGHYLVVHRGLHYDILGFQRQLDPGTYQGPKAAGLYWSWWNQLLHKTPITSQMQEAANKLGRIGANQGRFSTQIRQKGWSLIRRVTKANTSGWS